MGTRIEKQIKPRKGLFLSCIIRAMGKKKFLELIKKASQPVQPEQGKAKRADGYSGKQTRRRKS